MTPTHTPVELIKKIRSAFNTLGFYDGKNSKKSIAKVDEAVSDFNLSLSQLQSLFTATQVSAEDVANRVLSDEFVTVQAIRRNQKLDANDTKLDIGYDVEGAASIIQAAMLAQKPKNYGDRELRNAISEILVRNNLRTDQVAIGELFELMLSQQTVLPEGTVLHDTDYANTVYKLAKQLHDHLNEVPVRSMQNRQQVRDEAFRDAGNIASGYSEAAADAIYNLKGK